ncbi:MAG: lysylphosphatidylglycerol synthase transmembrane domain-containing protein [Puniceicoccaceae bacterium]
MNCPSPSPPRLRRWLSYALGGLLCSATIGFLLLKLTTPSFEWRQLAVLPAKGVLSLVLMVVTAWICNGLRTWRLSHIVGHPIRLVKAVGITLSMEFAIAATPAGFGGMVTRVALQKKQGIPYAASTAMMTADWVADLLFFAILTPVGIWQLAGLAAQWDLNWRVPGLLALALLACVLIGCCAWSVREKMRSWIPARYRYIWRARWSRLAETVSEHLQSVKQCARMVGSSHRMDYLWVLLFASVQWTCRYGILVVIFVLLGQSIPPVLLMLLQGSLFLLGLVVVLPGGGGSVEVLSTVALSPLVGVQSATLAVVIWRFFTYYLYLMGGGGAFLLNARTLFAK